jgi:hypothetical protein
MKASARIFNLLTVLVLGMTAMACLCAGVTFAYPQVFFNPLKPPDDALPALVPTVPTEAASATPIKYPTLAPVWTATPASTTTAAEAATSTPPLASSATETPSNNPTATHTPFPTPVGPTVTLTPTDLPTRTPTRRPPTDTPTHEAYPGPPTDTPVAIDTTVPTAYP